jgi:exodeoxyribonuclease VII large subunit
MLVIFSYGPSLATKVQNNLVNFVRMMENVNKIALSNLLSLIQESIEGSFFEQLWVHGEISEVTTNSSGHCYITLVEKGDVGIKARAQAIIWASTWRMLRPYFETTTGNRLQVGMHILVRVRVQYSVQYGLSLIVTDIDPAYTMGEAELRRQQTIAKLQQEGMMDMNSTLQMPRLPRRFALISAENAAGYGDFINHLHKNEWGFKFHTELFTAPLQGNDAPGGIIAAMEKVAERIDEFDALLIFRGGGSAVDLACFDDYELAVNIAQFPLPVLTAIGHERDYHIADMVSFMSVKTPTALADWIVDIYAAEDELVSSLATRLLLIIKSKRGDAAEHLMNLHRRLLTNIDQQVMEHKSRLDMLEYRVKSQNPEAILKKGFAIPLKSGIKVDSVEQLDVEDNITLLMSDGTVECRVIQVKR